MRRNLEVKRKSPDDEGNPVDKLGRDEKGNKIKRKFAKQALQILILYVRIEGIETLTNAIGREDHRISRSNAPENWLAWLKEIQETELDNIFGKTPKPTIKPDRHSELLNRCRKCFSDILVPIQIQITNDRIDYKRSLEVGIVELSRAAGSPIDGEINLDTVVALWGSDEFKAMIRDQPPESEKSFVKVLCLL